MSSGQNDISPEATGRQGRVVAGYVEACVSPGLALFFKIY